MSALWMSTEKERDRKKHAHARMETRKAVRAARMHGSIRRPWKQREEGIVASLCGAVSGQFSKEGEALVPVQSSMVKDENDNVCFTLEAQSERWRRHAERSVGCCGEAEKWKGWWCIWDVVKAALLSCLH